MLSLPTPRTPYRISSAVSRFCKSIKGDVLPMYVDVRPDEGAIPNECFANVDAKVRLEGGDIQYGWTIWQCENLFIEAEHHAVYITIDDEWVDITPHVPPVSRILFVPDPSAVFDISRNDRRDNHRMALSNDPRMHRMLELFAARVELLNGVPGIGFVSMTGDVLTRLITIEREVMALSTAIMRERTGTSWN